MKYNSFGSIHLELVLISANIDYVINELKHNCTLLLLYSYVHSRLFLKSL